jgi:hypothetical protein
VVDGLSRLIFLQQGGCCLQKRLSEMNILPSVGIDINQKTSVSGRDRLKKGFFGISMKIEYALFILAPIFIL